MCFKPAAYMFLAIALSSALITVTFWFVHLNVGTLTHELDSAFSDLFLGNLMILSLIPLATYIAYTQNFKRIPTFFVNFGIIIAFLLSVRSALKFRHTPSHHAIYHSFRMYLHQHLEPPPYLDYLQSSQKCCGIFSYMDYFTNSTLQSDHDDSADSDSNGVEKMPLFASSMPSNPRFFLPQSCCVTQPSPSHKSRDFHFPDFPSRSSPCEDFIFDLKNNAAHILQWSQRQISGNSQNAINPHPPTPRIINTHGCLEKGVESLRGLQREMYQLITNVPTITPLHILLFFLLFNIYYYLDGGKRRSGKWRGRRHCPKSSLLDTDSPPDECIPTHPDPFPPQAQYQYEMDAKEYEKLVKKLDWAGPFKDGPIPIFIRSRSRSHSNQNRNEKAKTPSSWYTTINNSDIQRRSKSPLSTSTSIAYWDIKTGTVS